MQIDRKNVVRLLGIGAVALCACGHALAQSPEAPVPDYAALIGLPMSKADVTRSRSVGESDQEVQRRIAAAGVRRTAAQRAASEGLNHALAKMPETLEQALREAAANKNGTLVLRTSRQQIQPIYATSATDTEITAAHGADQSTVR